jgi:hypothetical protein
MKVRIKGDKEFLRQLLAAAAEVRDACAQDVEAASKQALSASRASVPRDTGSLAGTGFTDKHHTHETSVSAVSGYEHEFAAHIHEGWKFGVRGPPPRFMTKGANAARGPFIDAVRSRVSSVLRRMFGQ